MNSRKPASAGAISGMPAGGTTVQRVIDNSTEQRVPLDWDTLSKDDVDTILQKIRDADWELEKGDRERLLAIIDQYDRENFAAERARQGIEEESSVKAENIEEEDDYADLLNRSFAEEVSEQEDPTFDGENMLNPDQQELYDKFYPMYKARMEEKERKYPGRLAQGSMLEFNFSNFSNDMGINEVDGNAASKNMPGIDHFVDRPSHLFVQDKLHLSEHTANTKTYRKHYENRATMAKKFLGSMAKDGKTGDKMRSTMESIANDPKWENKDSVNSIYDGVKKHRQEYRKALKSQKANTLPNIRDEKKLVDRVKNNIAFSVPSDIWEQLHEDKSIPPEEMRSYLRLDLSTEDFKQVFDRMNDVITPWNEKGIDPGDAAYELEEGDEEEDDEDEAYSKKRGKIHQNSKKIKKQRKQDQDDDNDQSDLSKNQRKNGSKKYR